MGKGEGANCGEAGFPQTEDFLANTSGCAHAQGAGGGTRPDDSNSNSLFGKESASSLNGRAAAPKRTLKKNRHTCGWPEFGHPILNGSKQRSCLFAQCS